MRSDVRAEMVDYDQVRERACISFIDSKGKPMSLWVQKGTYAKLMVGPWDSSKLGEPNLLQRELREALKISVKTNYVEWFTDNANALMKFKATGKSE